MNDRRTIFENGFIKIESENCGGRELISMDRIETQTGAVVVPILRDGRVVLIREYRHGAGQEVTGVVKGACDYPGEPACDVARRELEEELGLQAESVVETPLETYALPSLTSTRGKVVFAYGCEFSGFSEPEPGEVIAIDCMVSKSKLLDLIRNGGINDGESCLALQAFILDSI